MSTKTLGVVDQGSGRQNSIPTMQTIPTVPTIPTIPTPWGCSELKFSLVDMFYVIGFISFVCSSNAPDLQYEVKFGQMVPSQFYCPNSKLFGKLKQVPIFLKPVKLFHA